MRNWFVMRGAIVGVAVVALVWRETRRPLRARVERRLDHTVRNAAGAPSEPGGHLIEDADRPPRRHPDRGPGLGILPASPAALAERVRACVLMDYTLYVLHVLVTSTVAGRLTWCTTRTWIGCFHRGALHFGELLISIPWRLAQTPSSARPAGAADLANGDACVDPVSSLERAAPRAFGARSRV